MLKPLFILLLLLSEYSFSQSKNEKATNKPYFPTPFLSNERRPIVDNSMYHRNLPDMIGEEFLVLPLETEQEVYYGFRYADRPKAPVYSKDVANKKITLTAVNATGTEARFKDLNGTEYVKDLPEGIAPGFIATSEIAAANKLYLNATLWTQRPLLKVRSGKRYRHISVWEPLKIVKISASNASYTPVRLTFKTQKGEIGTFDTDISGTNTTNDANETMQIVKDRKFGNVFSTDDPKRPYKLSPAMWKIVENGKIYLGMPSAAFRVLAGEPKHINTTTGVYGVHEQWVYSDSYYYFENGKLTTVQN